MRSITLFAVVLLSLAGIVDGAPLLAAETVIPDAPVMRLDEIGLYDVAVAYRGKAERRFPTGWSGDFDDTTGVACRPAGEQAGRRAFLIHCPWRGGTGVTAQTFTIRLPDQRRVTKIFLRGATAMRLDAVGKSDGATFRVFANGRRLLDENRTDAAWHPFVFDLTPLAGKTVTLRFETDPGPKDNPSFDFSLWGDRELVLEGFHPVSSHHPDPQGLPLSRAVNTRHNDVVPTDGFGGTQSVRRDGNRVVFTYRGSDGTLEYTWRPPARPDDPPLGIITVRARMRGDTSVSLPLANASSIDWTEVATPVSSEWRRVSGGWILSRVVKVGNRTARLNVSGRLVGKSLTLFVDCDQPVVRAFDAGGWGPVMRRRQVVTPYYSGQVSYLPRENLFVNAALDWTVSNATNQQGTRAVYGALTDGSANRLRECAVYTAAWHLAEVLPNVPNAPSPYIKRLSSMIMLDVWGGRYTDIAKGLERLADYGIGPSAVIIHDWQRSGYDNALPAHIPAAADKGGDAGMKALVATAKRLGDVISLHENYVDYYPNFEGFDEKDVALDSAGKRHLAWYNPGTKIQSFAVKPNAILPLARTQSPEIHRRYGTNADYLDVHSAVPPWFHVDMRAGELGAGEFSQVWDVHRQLWQYERATHGGPVFGEGANHWYWSGALDGVEAQFGVGWAANAGTTAPLAVDFDLLKIHPLQFNHGMGYYERWWPEAKWGAIPPMSVLDQYRMQEVAYGHMGFLGAPTWNSVPLAWLEHNLLTPVTSRYAASVPARIEYHVNGRWVDGTAAAKAEDWRRVRVTYANGLTVTANSADTPLDSAGLRLPRFGWVARGAGVTAWTAERNGAMCDYAETADTVFANARSAVDWNLGGVKRVRPSVAQFAQTGPRAFQATYRWTVNDRLDMDYTCFVHFGKPGADGWDEGIKFQGDHPLSRKTTSWQPGEVIEDGPHTVRVPGNLPDGDYQWTIGLFNAAAGVRASIEGETDKLGRILLGVVQVRDNSRTIHFVPETRTGSDRLRFYTADLNTANRVVDFGAIRTDGSVKLRRIGGEWTLQTLPRDRAFTLDLSAARFGSPTAVHCDGGSSRTVTPVRHGSFWRLPLTGAREYRWKVQ